MAETELSFNNMCTEIFDTNNWMHHLTGGEKNKSEELITYLLRLLNLSRHSYAFTIVLRAPWGDLNPIALYSVDMKAEPFFDGVSCESCFLWCFSRKIVWWYLLLYKVQRVHRFFFLAPSPSGIYTCTSVHRMFLIGFMSLYQTPLISGHCPEDEPHRSKTTYHLTKLMKHMDFVFFTRFHTPPRKFIPSAEESRLHSQVGNSDFIFHKARARPKYTKTPDTGREICGTPLPKPVYAQLHTYEDT